MCVTSSVFLFGVHYYRLPGDCKPSPPHLKESQKDHKTLLRNIVTKQKEHVIIVIIPDKIRLHNIYIHSPGLQGDTKNANTMCTTVIIA